MEDAIAIVSVVLVALLLAINGVSVVALVKLRAAIKAHTEAQAVYVESEREMAELLEDFTERIEAVYPPKGQREPAEEEKPKVSEADMQARGGGWL